MDIIKDNSIFVLPHANASLKDRIKAAYYAFRLTVKPDIERIMMEIKKIHDKENERRVTLEEKREQALGNLDGYNKACVESIAAGTENWRLLFEHTMTAIERLETADQLTIMRYLFSGNRQIVREQGFRNWMARNAEALLDSIPE